MGYHYCTWDKGYLRLVLTLTQRNSAKHRATLESGIRLIYASSATVRRPETQRLRLPIRRPQVRVLPSVPLFTLQIVGKRKDSSKANECFLVPHRDNFFTTHANTLAVLAANAPKAPRTQDPRPRREMSLLCIESRNGYIEGRMSLKETSRSEKRNVVLGSSLNKPAPLRPGTVGKCRREACPQNILRS